ncbi:MAG: cell division protein ZapA [Methylobacterium sp.]|uniref:cell division protein ZapA n=1 Tax=Methylobacterium sp. TaxID=409 RepID=UPI002584E0F7|nr:cell division protein ZapA [Methylobacterium sp.]MBY0294671.1 cell division protein ZapA [Methylobacterium sp.]
MPQVTVSIAGKSYRMACGEGEERHLEELARGLDARIDEMRKAFGEIGDMRLHVMAALTLSDELAETRRRIETLEREIAAQREAADGAAQARLAAESRLAEGIGRAAERVEQIARRLSGAPGEG